MLGDYRIVAVVAGLAIVVAMLFGALDAIKSEFRLIRNDVAVIRHYQCVQLRTLPDKANLECWPGADN